MSPCRFLSAVALVGLLSVSASPGLLAAPAKAKVKTNLKANSKSHAHHLLKAEENLVEAEGAIIANNTPLAYKHVAAAIVQIEDAIKHHHTHHLSMPAGSGIGGAANRAHHHKHHSLLKQAEAELRAAEQQLKAGNVTAASKDIVLASKTIKAATASHHHLIKT